MKKLSTFNQFLIESINIDKLLDSDKKFDLQFPGKDSSNGWKLSLQGKSTEDAIELYKLTSDFLSKNDIAFKVATKKRINHHNSEQSKKLLTIYVPNSMDHLELAEKIYKLTNKYKGWYDIKTPSNYEHYAGPVFFRNDRDEKGNYIKSN